MTAGPVATRQLQQNIKTGILPRLNLISLILYIVYLIQEVPLQRQHHHIKLLFNMGDSVDYTKINLRKFRHEFTQLKDSLNSGNVYEIVDRGKPLAYLIPSEYNVKLKRKNIKGKEDFPGIVNNLFGCAKSVGSPTKLDYKKEYLKRLKRKYNV